jgi:hypothetical protein
MNTFTGLPKWKKVIVIVVSIGLAVFSLWRIVQGNRNAKLDKLYFDAATADRASLTELMSYKNAYATQLQLRLLHEHLGEDDAVTLARALSSRGVLDNTQLAGMLDVSSPGGPRHAAIEVLLDVGCDAQCQTAVLRELENLYSGKQTYEEKITVDRAKTLENSTPEKAEFLRDMAKAIHKRAQADALRLARKNSCQVLQAAHLDKNADTAFIKWLEPQLEPIAGCS